MKDVPTCHYDLQTISPPNWLIISLQICNPRPIPFVFNYYVVSKNPNNLKSLVWSLSFIPIPESSTIISTAPYFEFSTISLKTCCSGYDNSDFSFTIFPFTLT